MTIFWSITKLGRSVRRVIREGSLALFRTSYKGLSQRGIHPSSGVHHLFLKETSFTQNQPASHWPSLVCPISPPLLNGFQSSLISLESYFQGESNAVCYEGRGLLFMENVGNYRNCATRIILETIGVYPIRTYPFWALPLTLGVFFLHFPLLGVIFGVDFRQKHGFHCSITRVWDIGIVDRLCRLKLDLEAVGEDANEKVYSFQIQRSLIYLKFVGVVKYLILSQNHTKN